MQTVRNQAPQKRLYHGNWTELLRRREARKKLGLKGDPIPAANVGQRHPDYGMTPSEHMAKKAPRTS